jgi:hypothetical protein
MDRCRLLWKDSESWAAAWCAVLAARETALSSSAIVRFAWAAVLRCSLWIAAAILVKSATAAFISAAATVIAWAVCGIVEAANCCRRLSLTSRATSSGRMPSATAAGSSISRSSITNRYSPTRSANARSSWAAWLKSVSSRTRSVVTSFGTCLILPKNAVEVETVRLLQLWIILESRQELTHINVRGNEQVDVIHSASGQ